VDANRNIDLKKNVDPDFSPTKFFAGRGAGHEPVVSYCKCSATKQAAEKSVGPKGELFNLKQNAG